VLTAPARTYPVPAESGTFRLGRGATFTEGERVLDVLESGQVLGRYQIVRLIGQGGMGAVYEAVHVVLKKRFAIKTLLPSLAQTPGARARFLREGEAASRITHPNVVAVSDVGSEGDMPYMVMEFLEGQSLGDLLAERGRLDVREAVDILLPVISAVSVGHDQGVVHRDLKPQNVFLARAGWGAPVPKVLDFGVSKMTGGEGAALTGTLAVLGTASYMSPEQARGARQVDGQSDQYALGLVFYEMLTGSRAHPGENPLEVLHNIASGSIVPPRQLRPDLPDDVVAVLMRMLKMAPADRYPSLGDVGRALLPFAGDDLRVAMRDAFRAPVAAGAGPGGEAPRAMRATAVMPQSGGSGSGSAGGTKLLPDSESRPGTTLGQAASQIGGSTADARPARKGRGPAIIGGSLVGVAAAAVIALTMGGHKTDVATPSPQHESTAQAAVQPSPKPVEVVAPVAPPSVTPPPIVEPPLPAPVVPAVRRVQDISPTPTTKTPTTSSSRPEHQEHHSKRHAAESAPAAVPVPVKPPATAKPNCDQKFYLDAQGDKHFKPECFLNSK
jgi:tRNA A-37 threonylcarbamoyl transferase component Bud32